MRDGLFAGVRRFNADDRAKVLVLTGAGEKAFCAGGDLGEMSAEQLGIPPIDYVPQFGRNIEVAKPTIAAVNGAAFAGGFLLAQTCDLCIASTSATFAISEVRVGRGSPWAAPLPLMIPRRVAMEIVLTGAPMTAQHAHEIGFVNQLAEPDQLHTRAADLARTIVANAPLSILAGKQTMALTAEYPLRDAFDRAEMIWAPVYSSRDAQVARAHRQMSPVELLNWFFESRNRLLAAFTTDDPRRRLPWFGPDMSVASSATARLMETWAHGQDIFDAVGVGHPLSPGLRSIAHLGVSTFAFAHRLNGLEVPTEPVRVELDAPEVNAVWTWGPADAENRVSGPAEDFVLVVTQRRHPEDTELIVQGPVAVAWMAIAQAFAGAPGNGRPSRTAAC